MSESRNDKIVIQSLQSMAESFESLARTLEEIRLELKKKRIDDADRRAARFKGGPQ